MSNPAPVLSRSRASSLSRSTSSNLHHSHSQRPTTPLRRISSSSLRALSLSHSASRRSHGGAGGAAGLGASGGAAGAEGGVTGGGGGLDAVDSLQYGEAPLVHLAPVLAELADSVSDLTSNLDALELVHARLDGFNDALAAWLLGLRANGYTVDFVEAPTRLNFELSAQKLHERAVREEEERVKAVLLQQQEEHMQGGRRRHGGESESEDEGSDARHRYGAGDNTFVSGADASFVSNQDFGGSAPTSARGRGSGIRGGVGVRGGRGAGGRGGARGGSMAGAAGRKRKEEMATFADPILPLLPIDIREKRRAETEKVLWALRERPNGTTMQDLVASLAAAGPSQTVPQVRINECLLALARAKVVVKAVVKGATTYRLDPNKCAV
ncbi:hypothetical protein JCM10908_004967 [Rhodotorula pacifica]|uniref:uncharacterized protein n=1 Tax=Rhodotorula pacifica TaxID=1495444 RepID=UPI00316B7F5E